APAGHRARLRATLARRPWGVKARHVARAGAAAGPSGASDWAGRAIVGAPGPGARWARRRRPMPGGGPGRNGGSGAPVTDADRRELDTAVIPGRLVDLAAGDVLTVHRVRARNLFRGSANRIHDDAVARRYGFAGGLVAGTTIYAYLSHPLVRLWGATW